MRGCVGDCLLAWIRSWLGAAVWWLDVSLQTDGATPLYISSKQGHLPIVVALLDAGAALTVRVLGS